MMLEDGQGTSTLGDFNTALTVLLLTKLSKERVYYGDLQHIDKKKKEIKIIGDGNVRHLLPASWGRLVSPNMASLPKVRPAGFRSNSFATWARES
jgi:hypothetical protein